MEKIDLSSDGKTPNVLNVHWFNARSEFGKYSPCYTYKGRTKTAWTGDVLWATVLYSFDSLQDGKIPRMHQQQINQLLETIKEAPIDRKNAEEENQRSEPDEYDE